MPVLLRRLILRCLSQPVGLLFHQPRTISAPPPPTISRQLPRHPGSAKTCGPPPAHRGAPSCDDLAVTDPSSLNDEASPWQLPLSVLHSLSELWTVSSQPPRQPSGGCHAAYAPPVNFCPSPFPPPTSAMDTEGTATRDLLRQSSLVLSDSLVGFFQNTVATELVPCDLAQRLLDGLARCAELGAVNSGPLDVGLSVNHLEKLLDCAGTLMRRITNLSHQGSSAAAGVFLPSSQRSIGRLLFATRFLGIADEDAQWSAVVDSVVSSSSAHGPPSVVTSFDARCAAFLISCALTRSGEYLDHRFGAIIVGALVDAYRHSPQNVAVLSAQVAAADTLVQAVAFDALVAIIGDGRSPQSLPVTPTRLFQRMLKSVAASTSHQPETMSNLKLSRLTETCVVALRVLSHGRVPLTCECDNGIALTRFLGCHASLGQIWELVAAFHVGATGTLASDPARGPDVPLPTDVVHDVARGDLQLAVMQSAWHRFRDLLEPFVAPPSADGVLSRVADAALCHKMIHDLLRWFDGYVEAWSCQSLFDQEAVSDPRCWQRLANRPRIFPRNSSGDSAAPPTAVLAFLVLRQCADTCAAQRPPIGHDAVRIACMASRLAVAEVPPGVASAWIERVWCSAIDTSYKGRANVSQQLCKDGPNVGEPMRALAALSRLIDALAITVATLAGGSSENRIASRDREPAAPPPAPLVTFVRDTVSLVKPLFEEVFNRGGGGGELGVALKKIVADTLYLQGWLDVVITAKGADLENGFWLDMSRHSNFVHWLFTPAITGAQAHPQQRSPSQVGIAEGCHVVEIVDLLQLRRRQQLGALLGSNGRGGGGVAPTPGMLFRFAGEDPNGERFEFRTQKQPQRSGAAPASQPRPLPLFLRRCFWDACCPVALRRPEPQPWMASWTSPAPSPPLTPPGELRAETAEGDDGEHVDDATLVPALVDGQCFSDGGPSERAAVGNRASSAVTTATRRNVKKPKKASRRSPLS